MTHLRVPLVHLVMAIVKQAAGVMAVLRSVIYVYEGGWSCESWDFVCLNASCGTTLNGPIAVAISKAQ